MINLNESSKSFPENHNNSTLNNFQEKIYNQSITNKSKSAEETKSKIENEIKNNLDADISNVPLSNNGSKLIEVNNDENYEDSKNDESENNINSSNENNNNKTIFNEDVKKEINSSQNNSQKNISLESILFLIDYKCISCTNCKLNIIIDFTNNYNYITIKCDCNLIKNMKIEKFLEKFCRDEYYHKLNKCEIHDNDYTYYCRNCRENLCEECLLVEIKNPDGIIKKKHETHSKIQLNNVRYENGKFEILEKISNKYSNLDIFKLITNYIYIYKNSPSRNIYKTLKKGIEFINKYPNFPDNFFDNNINLEEINLKKIHSLEVLKEDFEKKKIEPKLIYKIDIKNENPENSLDLSILKGNVFFNLKSLILYQLNIKSIKPIINCEFPELIDLVLDNNKLDDDCIVDIKSLNLPKIIFLSLYNNNIKAIEIFEAINKIKTLEKFYIGQNIFDEKKLKNYFKYNECIELPENLIELGITHNFTGETNEYIKKIKMEKIEVLYIRENGLDSLKIFENFTFLNLREVWIENIITDISKLDELNHLKKNKNINVLNLGITKIKNDEFSGVIDFIKMFPKLTKLKIKADDNLSEKEIIKEDKINYVEEEINKSRQSNDDHFVIEYLK